MNKEAEVHDLVKNFHDTEESLRSGLTKKKELRDSIMDLMKSNNISQVSTSLSTWSLDEKRVQPPVTIRLLKEFLQAEGHEWKSSEEMLQGIARYRKANVKVKQTLSLKKN